MANLLVLQGAADSLQNGAGFIGKTLTHKGWPQCHKVSSWQVRQSRLCQKEKNKAVCPDYQIVRWERVRVSKSRTLSRERGFERDHEEKKVESKVKEGCSKEEKEGEKEKLSRRSRKKHERVSGRKSFSGGSGESWFCSKSSKSETEKEVGRRTSHLDDYKAK